MVGVFLDAMITKYSRHYFDAVSYNMIGVFLRCFSNLYYILFKQKPFLNHTH